MDTSTGLCQLVKRIRLCMDKSKKKWGKICIFFADERYLRLSKICSLGIALPYVYYLYKKGFKYCNLFVCLILFFTSTQQSFSYAGRVFLG